MITFKRNTVKYENLIFNSDSNCSKANLERALTYYILIITELYLTWLGGQVFQILSA